MKSITLLAAGLSLAGVTAPAIAATTVDTTACQGFTVSSSCRFNGNINASAGGNNSYLDAQSAYNALFNPDIVLSAILSTGSGVGTNGAFDPGSSTSGTWSLPGFNVQYLAVKASTYFVLYKVSGSSGTWTTSGITNNGGQTPGLSHLVFFGTNAAVPEPSAWALMILGLGAAGAASAAVGGHAGPCAGSQWLAAAGGRSQRRADAAQRHRRRRPRRPRRSECRRPAGDRRLQDRQAADAGAGARFHRQPAGAADGDGARRRFAHAG